MPGRIDEGNDDALAGISEEQAAQVLQAAGASEEEAAAGAAEAVGAASSGGSLSAYRYGQSQRGPRAIYAVNTAGDPDWDQMAADGTTLIVADDDPQADDWVRKAREHGVRVGVNVAARGDVTPEQYAEQVRAANERWNPDMFVFDVEGVGKGYAPGDAHYNAAYDGWNWSQQAAGLAAAAAGGKSFAVTMEPNQDDYNYGAWTGVGADVWVQSYGADPSTDQRDPDSVFDQVVRNGVDPNRISVITAPGQRPGSRGGSVTYGYNAPPHPPGSSAPPGSPPSPPPPSPPPSAGPAGSPVLSGTSGHHQGYNPPAVTAPPWQPGDPIPPGWVVSADGTHLVSIYDPTGEPGPAPAPGANGEDEAAWIQYYFGSLGLPQDVIDELHRIFVQYGTDQNKAAQIALAYIRSTPWYGEHFQGIQYGMAKGLFSDERGYIQYVTQVNNLARQYWGRNISGSEISSFLYEGLTPDLIQRQYAGLAAVIGQGADWNYLLGNFGGGQLSMDDLRAFGEDPSGLGSAVGARVKNQLDQALSRYNGLLRSQAATPALSLTGGRLSAPSLGKGDVPDIPA